MARTWLTLWLFFDFENLIHEATRTTKTCTRLCYSMDFCARAQKIHFKSLKNFDIDNFCSNLNDTPSITVMNCFEDDITFAFQSLYTAILHELAPLKSVQVQGNQVPFLNESWRKAIGIVITFGEPLCDTVQMQITQPLRPRGTFALL